MNRQINREEVSVELGREQWRILVALLGGAELMQRPGEDWLLDGKEVAFSDLQPLWDAELVTFRFPMTETVYLQLTPAGAAQATLGAAALHVAG
ncbi:hypothetical protein ACMT4L_19825 [Deinococcus sp. A31D244]|uniref:hypothetical protein n=1 Tax=Deinococcus sp. A31D244 TaxID=3397675 RepID=UPI0039E1154F